MTAAVKERPILFSGPMVLAILDGRKTQTRRIIKPQPKHDQFELCNFAKSKVARDGTSYPAEDERFGICDVDGEWSIECRHKRVCDRMWVRETWAPLCDFDLEFGAMYRADNYPSDKVVDFKWKPSIHMPRWASRITLEITGVRVERLQDVSEADAMAEGCERIELGPHEVHGMGVHPMTSTYGAAFADLWERINGFDSWDANPWVWVIEFRRIGQ
jgi:hypothetical protein